VIAMWAQPLPETQRSSVQALPSSQDRGAPPWQVPAWQVSPPLHGSASAQEAPSVTGEHWPTDPVRLHVSQLPEQARSQQIPLTHTPERQSSVWAHPWPLSARPMNSRIWLSYSSILVEQAMRSQVGLHTQEVTPAR